MRKYIIFLLFIVLFACAKTETSDTAADRSYIIKNVTVYAAKSEYLAWPSIIKAANGDLIAAFCRTEEHLGPDGQILMVRSSDNGETWTKPKVIFETPLDDRESGLTILRDGKIIGHYWSTFHTRERYMTVYKDGYSMDLLEKWSKHVDSPEYQNAKSQEGGHACYTFDDGITWSAPVPCGDTVHGGIQLQNGDIFIATYRQGNGKIRFVTAHSIDGPYEITSTYTPPSIDTLRFGEPHILQLKSGRILMMLRASAVPYNDEKDDLFMWYTWSDDNGQTWADAVQTDIWGYPPHLLQLSDGRILCTYGYRRPPYGQRACISDDGMTWSKENEFILRDDAYNKDLGYPASVELEPGKILSIYYQPDPADGPQKMDPPDPKRSRPDIYGTIWRVPPKK